jgi:hypothetical protein
LHEALLGAAPEKVLRGYANCSLPSPALTLTLNEGAASWEHSTRRASNCGRPTTSLAARLRLAIWVHDPDGTPWEIFTVRGDGDEAPAELGAGAATRACC